MKLKNCWGSFVTPTYASLSVLLCFQHTSCAQNIPDGPTLKDKIISLVFPESSNEQIIVTYHCIDDKREARDTHQLVPVWNCNITGQIMEKETDRKSSKENIDNIVTPATIVAYLDKKNLKIVDLLCF